LKGEGGHTVDVCEFGDLVGEGVETYRLVLLLVL
jgi:hypothetical protein